MSDLSNKLLQFDNIRSALLRSVVPALILILTYYIISLLDLWSFAPSSVQAVSYILMLVAAVGLMGVAAVGKIKFSRARATRRLSVMVAATIVLAVTNMGELPRLTSLAFMPRALFDYPQADITVTVTPPAYLEKSSIYLTMDDLDSETITVHEGSVMDIQVKDLKWGGNIVLSDGHSVPLEADADGIYKASMMLSDQNRWTVKQGTYVAASWPIAVTDDPNPQVKQFALVDNHSNDKGYIALKLEVNDDRKIMDASVELVDDGGIKSDKKQLAIRGIDSYESVFYLDFTGSQRAGSTVDLLVSVEDEAGQIATSLIKDVDLPEKEYRQPIANKLISLHNEFNNPDKNLKSLARQIKALGLLSDEEGLPPVYYMAMRSAYWRLINPTAPGDHETSRDLLWDIAQKIEDGEIGPKENALIYSLDELNLKIRQSQPVSDIRESLRKTDHLFRDYRNTTRSNFSERYSLEIDMKALRKLYSYILAYSDQGKYHNASLIVDIMRKGLVQNDALILSKDGLGNYFALAESKQIIDNLISIQKTLLASSYNNQMKNKLVDKASIIGFTGKSAEDKNNEMILQTKVGAAVKKLGEKISFADDYSEYLIEDAALLIDEILTSMKNSETNQVTRSQSQLLTVMSNIKRLINKPISSTPELQNILEEINSQPVS